MPLPGVSVLIKGTNPEHKQILTENFLSKQALTMYFVFSYIGMKNEELTAKSITLKVVMQSNTTELERYSYCSGDKREESSWLCRE
jgi:hypothetical protein